MTFAAPAGYSLDHEVPALDDYQRLRAMSGLSPFSEAAARAGLPGTYIGVVVRHDATAVGMGRIVGDGGLFFQLVDIAVDPAHQGKGLGKAVVAALLEALAARIAAPAYVSLVADGRASELYAQHGFAPVAPKSQGMAVWLLPTSTPSPL
ncbi:GNAT family N-acetyltransferase [Tsuneonella sp. HG222]